MEDEIRVKLRDALEKRYRVRRTGENGASFETTIPREVVAREAKKLGVPIEEISENIIGVWRYNNFRGIHFEFIEREKADPTHKGGIGQNASEAGRLKRVPK